MTDLGQKINLIEIEKFSEHFRNNAGAFILMSALALGATVYSMDDANKLINRAKLQQSSPIQMYQTVIEINDLKEKASKSYTGGSYFSGLSVLTGIFGALNFCAARDIKKCDAEKHSKTEKYAETGKYANA